MNFFWLLNILLKISSVSQMKYTKKSGNLGMAFCAANDTSRNFIFFLDFSKLDFFYDF